MDIVVHMFLYKKVEFRTNNCLLVYLVRRVIYMTRAYVYPSACSGGVCTYTPSSAFASGDYKFKMSTYNSYGDSGYSGFVKFTVP